MSKQTIFITGTDTDVGKTHVGVQLVTAMRQHHLSVAVRKPVESGCESIDGQKYPSDAAKYWHAIEQHEPLETICPFRYAAPLAPPAAARQEGSTIELQSLLKACTNKATDYLIIEGAGGFYSPLAEDALNADLAVALDASILLVAANRLGCINHVLLTLDAIKQRGLSVNAVVLNEVVSGEALPANKEALVRLQETPIFCIGHNKRLNADQLLSLLRHPLESFHNRVG